MRDEHGHRLSASEARSKDPLVLRRDDLAAVVAAYRRACRGPRQWIGVAVGVGGTVLSALILTARSAFGWSAALDPALFALGPISMIAALIWTVRNSQRLRAHYQLPCPACGAPMIDARAGRTTMSSVDLAVATGRCQTCGDEVLAP